MWPFYCIADVGASPLRQTASEPKAEEAPIVPPPAVPSEQPYMPAGVVGRTRTETTSDLGYLYAGRLTLIRGMANRVAQVRRLFFQQSEARGISGASYSPGQLMVENQTRDYQFAERDLGSSAKATIGVRIADIGTDLYVEWRHYVLPPKEFNVVAFLVIGAGVSLGSCGLVAAMANSTGAGAIIGILAGLGVGAWVASNSRAITLKGFQTQDSDAFQLAIRAAVDEAIDLAGITKELRTETEYKSQLPAKKRFI
jgi:hypothetical protein